MVCLYFGLPGCGKTTMLAKMAFDAVRHGRYKYVYSNVHLNIPGVTFIDNECIGKYELRDCLLLIDEATLFADNRAHRDFSKGKLEYFLEHRHRNADIALFTQQWDGVDRKIRVITDRVYYIKKGLILGHWFSSCYRIPYDIIIPDPKKAGGGEKLGEIIQGYCKPPWFIRLFCQRIYRPKYYPFFDSWDLDPFPDLPARYAPIERDEFTRPFVFRWIYNTGTYYKKSRRRMKEAKRAQKREILFTRKVFHPGSLQRLPEIGGSGRENECNRRKDAAVGRTAHRPAGVVF